MNFVKKIQNIEITTQSGSVQKSCYFDIIRIIIRHSKRCFCINFSPDLLKIVMSSGRESGRYQNWAGRSVAS